MFRLGSFGLFRFAFVATLSIVCWSALNAAVTDYPERFLPFLLFDVLSASAIVLAVLISRDQWQRGGARAARAVVQGGAVLVILLVSLPHLLFSVADADVALTQLFNGALGDSDFNSREASVLPSGDPNDPGEQNFLIHLGIIAALAGVVGVEVKTQFLERNSRLASSAAKATPHTLVDVLRTLPIVLAALFLVAFVEELWIIVGELDLGRLALLTVIPFLSVVWFIKSAAQDEAERALTGQCEPAAVEDHENDVHLPRLVREGVQPRPLQATPELRRSIERQWRMHIGLRVLLAGGLIALLALAVSGLTMSEAVLENWLGEAGRSETIESWTVPIGIAELYFTSNAAAVAVFLGAFASVVFVASALSPGEARDRLLAPERERMRLLLTIAGMYDRGLDEGTWRSRPGQTWKSFWEFVTEDPGRRTGHPVVFGSTWREVGEAARWTAEWNPETGEIYAYRSKRFGSVEMLAVCREKELVEGKLEGWEQRVGESGSLEWLRKRARALAEPDRSGG